MNYQLFYLFVLGVFFYSPQVFAQTATDLNCTSCVQTAEIQNKAITATQLRDSAVTTAKISDDTITNADISSTAEIDALKISGTAWTSTNDGSGSSLEADLLDGLDGAQFLRSDTSGTISGDLTATGNLSGTGVCMGADCRSVWPVDGEENPWEDGGDGIISYSGGNVGIGTVMPLTKLEVYGTDAGSIVHYQGESRGGMWALSDQRVVFASTTAADDLMFGYGSPSVTSANFVERMRIDNSTGNIGIGTTDPQEALDVHGTIRINGWDAVLHSRDSSGRSHDLIGTYEGWNPETIYIAGYNAINAPGSKSTKYVVTGPLRVDLSNDTVGIGTNNPLGYKLAVEGILAARELIVTEESWNDFVFEDDYQLKSLAEVESFIEQNKHLPDIPSEKEVLANGVSVGDMQKRLLQKVEELTLYVIAQDKKIAELERGEHE